MGLGEGRKSQPTLCLVQFRHDGRSSSHWTCQMGARGLFRAGRDEVPGCLLLLTLIFRRLQVLHPVFVLGRCLFEALPDNCGGSGVDW